MCRQVKTLRGLRLVQGIAGYVTLKLGEINRLSEPFYVEHGLEDLGREIEKLSNKPYLGRARERGQMKKGAHLLVVFKDLVNPKEKALALRGKLQCIYLVEGRNS